MQASAPEKQQLVRLSLDVTPEMHTALKLAATRHRMTMSKLLRQILQSSLEALGESAAGDIDLEDIAVRRHLAAASVAGLGDFWDNEIDAQWQDFQP
jgi:hypothetical protein